jgi:uncharacterized membrane protein YesL
LKLNLLTLLCCLPLVTAGAALTALHYCLLKMLDQEEGKILPMYFGQFKENLRPMLVPWLILGGSAAVLFLDLKVFPGGSTGAASLLRIPVYLGLFLLHGICQWIFPMAAVLDNGAGAKFRNAFLMMAGALPRTLAMMALSAVIPFVLFYSVRLLPLAFLFGISLPAYFCAFLYSPVIKGQLERLAGEGNGEAERSEEDPEEEEEMPE